MRITFTTVYVNECSKFLHYDLLTDKAHDLNNLNTRLPLLRPYCSYQIDSCSQGRNELNMVCDACQTKVTKIAVPDKWKEGSRNCVGSSSGTGGPVKAGKTNKALQVKVSAQWIPSQRMCRICKSKTLANMNFCNDCAHKKGICSMCGKKCMDISAHNMSLV